MQKISDDVSICILKTIVFQEKQNARETAAVRITALNEKHSSGKTAAVEKTASKENKYLERLQL